MTESGSGHFNVASVPDSYRKYLQPAIFDPWALELLSAAPPGRGDVVLDVAAGTGAVAHAAVAAVGTSGRVIASDISPLMLTETGATPRSGRAPIELLECPADAITLPDQSVDRVYCQQGLQFMPDREAVMAELHRVLRPGGTVAVAIWSDQASPEPFATYASILQGLGVVEPYPYAYDTSTVTMSEDDVEGLLVGGSLLDVKVRTVELPLAWPEPSWAAHGILGSSFGPTVAKLSPEERDSVFNSILEDDLSRGGVMSAVLGWATRD